jgi:hypothetical protein
LEAETSKRYLARRIRHLSGIRARPPVSGFVRRRPKDNDCGREPPRRRRRPASAPGGDVEDRLIASLNNRR